MSTIVAYLDILIKNVQKIILIIIYHVIIMQLYCLVNNNKILFTTVHNQLQPPDNSRQRPTMYIYFKAQSHMQNISGREENRSYHLIVLCRG